MSTFLRMIFSIVYPKETPESCSNGGEILSQSGKLKNLFDLSIRRIFGSGRTGMFLSLKPRVVAIPEVSQEF